jgi:hypothetical protein
MGWVRSSVTLKSKARPPLPERLPMGTTPAPSALCAHAPTQGRAPNRSTRRGGGWARRRLPAHSAPQAPRATRPEPDHATRLTTRQPPAAAPPPETAKHLTPTYLRHAEKPQHPVASLPNTTTPCGIANANTILNLTQKITPHLLTQAQAQMYIYPR